MSENIIKEIEKLKAFQNKYRKDSETYKSLGKIIEKLEKRTSNTDIQKD